VRDSQGAVRYLDHGNLPFTDDIIAFHKEKIAQKEKAMEKKLDYRSIVQDISSIAHGRV
jgi:methylaspartate mutase epsilon subunit